MVKVIDDWLDPEFCDHLSYDILFNMKHTYGHRSDYSAGTPRFYRADFVGHNFIIECKGRANETFPIRWKLFKMYLYHTRSEITLYKPQNQKECDETVSLILGNKKI